MIAGGVIWLQFTQPLPVFDPREGAKLFEAARAYSKDLRAHGTQEPIEVTLKELLAKGWLKADEVTSLAGLDVTIFPNVNESNPQATLIRVRLSDGSELDALGDGSVQSMAGRR